MSNITEQIGYTPPLTVILPNYNHAPFLAKRIDSILQQTYQDFELIILDDKSTDQSLHVIQQYEHHPKVSHVIANKHNSGSTFLQWKKGVHMAKGKYIWIAESDDFSENTFLETLLPFIERDKKIALVYAQSDDVDTHGNYIRNRIFWTEDFTPNIWRNDFVIEGNDFINQFMLYKNVIPNASAVIFRKDVFIDRYNPIVAHMKMAGDWLLWLSMIAGHKVAFVSSPLNKFRKHEATTRVHNTHEKKRRRIEEEVEVINAASAYAGINQQIIQNRYKATLNNWFILFPYYKNMFRKDYYNICRQKNLSPLSLIVKRLRYKK
ncbi:glycosyltransferase [Porifericola rhodea]|uniref:glycosyltransferase n=1 Tax=Porifericola rhodea TaxID=930972 RepID=UPI0026669580|nr:glycosyltransferase [Porifericola rhodea]WKN33489.1 glycosyltransferase [Porifericola rhodea]